MSSSGMLHHVKIVFLVLIIVVCFVFVGIFYFAGVMGRYC
jgi:hypothetical protein